MPNLPVATPFFATLEILEKVTIGTLTVLIQTAAPGSFQAALYARDPSTGDPTLLRATASGSTAAVGIVTVTFSSAVTLLPDRYLVGLMMDNTTAEVAGAAISAETFASLFGIRISGRPVVSAGGYNSYRAASAGTFGSWPSKIAGSVLVEQSATLAPAVWLRPAT